jgi:hypothetical protein
VRLGWEKTPAGSCRWFADGERRVCWSASWQVALVILQKRPDDAWQEILRVDRIGAHFSDEVFRPSTDGLVEMDLDRDPGD